MMLAAVWPFISNAQFGDLLNKAKNKVKQRVDNKVDKTMDNTLDKAEGKNTQPPVAKKKRRLLQLNRLQQPLPSQCR